MIWNENWKVENGCGCKFGVLYFMDVFYFFLVRGLFFIGIIKI